MASKSKRPAWFKLWLHVKPIVDAVPDDVAGRAVKAALNYFSTGEVASLGPLETVVFAPLKLGVDEANAAYLQDVENGKKGGRPKLTDEEKPPVREGYQPLPTVTERDRDREGEEKKERSMADKPPAHSTFVPPTVEQVNAYCAEKGYVVDAGRFVDYYASNGWKVGRNPMRNWQAAVRRWSGKEQKNGEAESKPTWTVGTTV